MPDSKGSDRRSRLHERELGGRCRGDRRGPAVGQEERVRLRILTTAGRQVIVYAAPATYTEQQALELRPGKTVEVTGSPAKYGSQTVLVAGSLSCAGKTVSLRDDKGRVTWSKE